MNEPLYMACRSMDMSQVLGMLRKSMSWMPYIFSIMTIMLQLPWLLVGSPSYG